MNETTPQATDKNRQGALSAKIMPPAVNNNNPTPSYKSVNGEARNVDRLIDEAFHRILGGEKPETRSGQARVILGVLLEQLESLGQLGPEQQASIERILAAAMRFIKRLSSENEAEIKHGLHLPDYLDEDGCYDRPHWADHGETWTDKKTRTKIYVAHPYELSESDFREFLRLTAMGYDVSIDGQSHYFPGETVRVIVSQRDERSMG